MCDFRFVKVALLVSAWIEILRVYFSTRHLSVALLVSAWIEINFEPLSEQKLTRRTPRECVD